MWEARAQRDSRWESVRLRYRSFHSRRKADTKVPSSEEEESKEERARDDRTQKEERKEGRTMRAPSS